MRNVFTSRLLALMLVGLTILAIQCPKTSLATETDPYTYSCIKLEDSAPKINYMLNGILRETFSKVNADILRHNHRTDVQAEFYFSHYYFKKMFVDNYGKDAFSVFETCINTNSCEGWPYFERIYLNPRESVYQESDYSELTNKFVAATVNVCGVRMGTDKLTHLLKEGFRLYNAKKNNSATDEDILRYSEISENTFFGKYSTRVFSQSDIVANLKGVQFFDDLWTRHAVREKTGLIRFYDVDICDYVDPRFDERVLENKYFGSPKKIKQLKAAMHNRILECTDRNREEILARKASAQSVGVADTWNACVKSVVPYLTSPEFRTAADILMESVPVYQERANTIIPKEK